MDQNQYDHEASEIAALEREMNLTVNLTALIQRLETPEEFEAARAALSARFKVVAKAAAVTLLPTYKVGDTVLFKAPDPNDVPIAGKVVRVGEKMNLDVVTPFGVIKIPVFLCQRVDGKC